MAVTEKVFNTRIQLKYDSYANWTAENPVLKIGEVAIATVDTADRGNGNDFTNLPNIILKIGNGTAPYNELKFVSGLAADVYAWAKDPSKPTYTADEITNLKEFVDTVIGNHTEIQDTDTRYTVVRDDANPYSFKLMSTDPAKTDNTFDILVATIDFSDANKRITALEELIGDESVNAQITSAIDALDKDDAAETGKFVTAVAQENGLVKVSREALAVSDIPELPQSKVTGLEAALADLESTKQDNLIIDGEVSEENKVATQSTVNSAIGALDFAEMLVPTGYKVSVLMQTDGRISASTAAIIADDIPELPQSKITNLTADLAAKQDVLGFAGEYNKETNPVATKQYVLDSVADLSGAMHFVGKVDTDPTTWEDNADYSAGDVVLFGYDEYVFDGNVWLPLGNESIYALKTDVAEDLTALETKLQGEIDTLDAEKQDNLNFTDTSSESNPVTTKTYVDNAIATYVASLDKGDAAVAGQFVTAVSEDNGIITVSREALKVSDIPTLPTDKISGLDDIIAGLQEDLVFDQEYDPETNKVATQATVTNAIGALDKQDEAVPNQFVTAVKEENGIITVSRAQPTADNISGLANIAKTANVNDLVQDSDTVVVLNCGTATTVM